MATAIAYFDNAVASLPPRLRSAKLWMVLLPVVLFLGAIYWPKGDLDALHLDAFVRKGYGDAYGEQGVAHSDGKGPVQLVAEAVLSGDQELEKMKDLASMSEGPRLDAYGHQVPHYRKLYSLTSPEKKYWPVWWNGEAAYNPNLVPHPTKPERWVVMAQHDRTDEPPAIGAPIGQEFICEAGFFQDKLVCQDAPIVLPIAPSIEGNCTGDKAWVNMAVGPRDGRMFMGPENPFIMYGSQSRRTCLSLWLQDARSLLLPIQAPQETTLFKEATELQRPEPYAVFEKNFFVFWDAQGIAYVHHDIYPKRVFAQLGPMGNVGDDLAPAAAESDARCMAYFMPKILDTVREEIHQATNSLSITLCKRSDPACKPSDDNTFIMHLFHWKSYYEMHGIYEPYIILFKRSSPFEIHAIGQRPFWAHGRNLLTPASPSPQYRGGKGSMPIGHSERLYFTSISWKNHGQTYHGFMDDPVFLAFGIEDGMSGVIDVMASDLLQDLALCEVAKTQT